MPPLPTKARLRNETTVREEVRLALSEAGLLVIVNSQYFGYEVDVKTGARRAAVGGLGEGSSDLVCVLPPTGRMCVFEVKRDPSEIPSAERIGWLKKAVWSRLTMNKGDRHDLMQALFIERVRQYGGFGCYIASAEDVPAAVERARRGERE